MTVWQPRDAIGVTKWGRTLNRDMGGPSCRLHLVGYDMLGLCHWARRCRRCQRTVRQALGVAKVPMIVFIDEDRIGEAEACNGIGDLPDLPLAMGVLIGRLLMVNFRRFVRLRLFRNIHDVALMLNHEAAGREWCGI